MPGPSADNDNAQRSLRDLASLLTLPALWMGRDAATVLQMTTEAMERLVRLDMSYASVPVMPDQPALERLRVKGLTALAQERDQWRHALAQMAAMPFVSKAHAMDSPMGPIRVVRLGLRVGAHNGSLWFGSSEPTFPSDSDVILLKAAASLAATGIQSARLEEERRRASRTKDEFLAMLGHELRNPLAPIFSALDLIRIQQGGKLDAAHSVIDRQAKHLSVLVDDLLDISRVVTGKVQLVYSNVPLRTVLERAIEAARPLIDQRKHRLAVEWPDPSMTVHGDATRLSQIFSNLLTNAAKYTPEQGRIELRCHIEGQKAVVSVRDNGLGISDDLKPRLFDLFEQGKTAIDRSHGGLGIGLALVKNFVTLHGGDVWVDSAGAGQGSTFTVVLPLGSAAQILESDIPIEPAASRQFGESSAPQRVLLVDDNIEASQLLAEVLSLSGFEVKTAAHPRTALEIFESFQPDVALLDIGLPEIDGLTLAGMMKRAAPAPSKLRVITLSGYGQPEDHRRAANAGIERHLVKPIDFDVLVDVLQSSS